MSASRWIVLVTGAALVGGGLSLAVASSAGEQQDGQAKSREARRQHMAERLKEQFDLSNPIIDLDKLLAGGPPKDGIPALTDPERAPASEIDYLGPDDRVIEVEINKEAVAYPLKILNYHEIANDEVGGVPVAVTYCPLCDSASVLDRRLKTEEGERVLEFGVSGFLYNSNVMMYERSTDALWSQVLMKAVTGPNAGAELRHYPVRLTTFGEFAMTHPGGEVLTTNTGHQRDYTRNPYSGYLSDPERVFHNFEYDDRLGPKVLGVGIVAGDRAIFVPADRVERSPVLVRTDAGTVKIAADEAGVRVLESPKSVKTMQTFYHSWAAFHPETEILPEDAVRE